MILHNMVKLANKLNKADAIKLVEAEPFKRRTISFYRYARIGEPEIMRDELWRAFEAMGVLGRIYLAKEGINAQISVPEHNEAQFRRYLNHFPQFKNVPFKYGLEEAHISFWKLTIKVREQIVADGLPDEAYDLQNIGRHLTAKEWNEAADNGAIVVDMRNGYESSIGRFKDAVTPKAETFREELPEVLETLKDKKDQKILLYCTGGVRCEKTSAFLKHHGFTDVNQLHGGIIEYNHQVKRDKLENKFVGKNYVFDGRTTETITEDKLADCLNCGEKTNRILNCANNGCHALFTQCENCGKELEDSCSKACQEILHLPVDKQKQARKGKNKGINILAKTLA